MNKKMRIRRSIVLNSSQTSCRIHAERTPLDLSMTSVVKSGFLKKSSEILGGRKLLFKQKWCIIERLADGTRRFLYFDDRKVRVRECEQGSDFLLL